jgi:hypothetical protein
MDLRCPQCNSGDLKKVSLVYQEGISHVNAGTQLRSLHLHLCGTLFEPF